MNKILKYALILGFFLGIPANWIIPYSNTEFLGIYTWIYVAIIFSVGGLLFRLIWHSEIFKTAFLMVIGFVVALIARMSYDMIFIDNTMHNLFPIELIMNVLPSFIGSLLGLFISILFKK